MPEPDTTPAADELPLPDQREFDELHAAARRMQARRDARVTAAAYRDAADWLTAEYPGPGADRSIRLAADRLRARADQMGQQ